MSPRRSPQPSERQRDPERTRAAILDAAVAEFAAHGFAGARIAAIAARAGVNQQLISYYFDGKEGLYQALSEAWRDRDGDLAATATTPAEQVRRYALEALHNADAVRLMAWGGLEYSGPASDADHRPRAERLQRSVDELKALQADGKLSADLDPGCLLIALMAAAMAPVTLPHVVEGLLGVDARSPEFLTHYADQLALLANTLGLAD
ncbi:hypothetical protein GCM10009804_46570 [Kribbella hippodromi]|uniref:HTH tetR-type domain-containing protein n=1 Tax=Kribbella hippodromi TaxID=434347 RepID=A0ABN2DS71_9ACTN